MFPKAPFESIIGQDFDRGSVSKLEYQCRRFIGRRFRRVFTAATILIAVPFSMALAEAKNLCRSFAVQPETFFGLEFVNTKQFDDAKLGVFVKFGARNQILSIFKYDDGRTRITDDFLQEKLAASQKSIEKSVAKRGDRIVSPAKTFVWKMGDAVFHGVVLQATRDEHDLNSFEFVGLSHNTACLLKVRFTDALNDGDGLSFKRYKSYVREAHELFE